MADEVEEHTAAGSATGEERYPDPYGLYRRWFDASGDAGDEESRGTLSSAELEESWRRWFGAVAGLRGGTLEAGGESSAGLTPLWREMADDISARMLSGESLPEDPVKSFLRWYKKTQERWSERADELLRMDEVLESTRHSFEAHARSEAELGRVSEEGLRRLRVPTRSDVARVAKLVVVVENKVDRIEEALEEFVYGDSEPATAAAVESLEGRMERLEGKMDRILAALEKLGGDDVRKTSERASDSTTHKDPDEAVMPLEGLSLELIEAGYVGLGGRGIAEDPKTKDGD